VGQNGHFSPLEIEIKGPNISRNLEISSLIDLILAMTVDLLA